MAFLYIFSPQLTSFNTQVFLNLPLYMERVGKLLLAREEVGYEQFIGRADYMGKFYFLRLEG